MTKNPSFSIIIPNYNGSKFLPDCLYSLYQSIKFCSGQFEIIIVDNASIDNSLDLINNFFNQYRSTKLSTKVYQLKTNTGFAQAVNFGINQSQYDYVVICNNDLTLEKNWFQLISKTISNNKNSKITTFFGTVLNKDGSKFESQGFKFDITGKVKNISNHKPFKKSLLGKNKIVWGTSAALVVYQKEIIKKIGLFDKTFFAYQEDVDISLRLAKLHYKTLYIPSTICYHLGGGTSQLMKNIRSRLCFRNWFFIIIKNYSFTEFFNNFFGILKERCRNFSFFFKETIAAYQFKSIYILPYDFLKTIFEIFFYLPKMLKKRKHFQKLLKSIKV